MTGGDREKLAREMDEAFSHSSRSLHIVATDIAIAYADRRVAEAVRDHNELCARRLEYDDYRGLAIKIRALSPAREGGGDE